MTNTSITANGSRYYVHTCIRGCEPAFEGTRATLEEARGLAAERRGGCHYVEIYFDGHLAETSEAA